MTARTKACDITLKVRQAVAERDSYDDCPCCIFCGTPRDLTIAHFIPRSRGGMGVEENLACACVRCHAKLDFTTEREEMLEQFREYLSDHYEGWDEEDLYYSKS